MDENHQDTTESKLTTTKDLRWVIKGKSKLWVPKRKRQTGFSGKTLWDWLNLLGILAIPLVVVGATIAFGLIQTNLAQKQHDSDQAIAKQQHASDQAIALDQQRAAILQTYIDNIQDLLLNHNLLGSRPTDDGAILARARTLTALQGLDPVRKGLLVQFIYEAKLIGFVGSTGKPLGEIIDLVNADLSSANLNGANLGGAHLHYVKLSGALLSYADLIRANLSNSLLNGTNLSNSLLSYADFHHADLNFANLSGADLYGAMLYGANLSSSVLSKALLFRAILYGANLRKANLSGADLSGATYNTKPILVNDAQGNFVFLEPPTQWPQGFNPQVARAHCVDC